MLPGDSVWTTYRVDVGTKPQISAAPSRQAGPIHRRFDAMRSAEIDAEAGVVTQVLIQQQSAQACETSRFIAPLKSFMTMLPGCAVIDHVLLFISAHA
jgi:negative regulator of sigma E activity